MANTECTSNKKSCYQSAFKDKIGYNQSKQDLKYPSIGEFKIAPPSINNYIFNSNISNKNYEFTGSLKRLNYENEQIYLKNLFYK